MTQPTKISTTIPTYGGDGNYGQPLTPVDIKIGEGVGIDLAPNAAVDATVRPDVYVERRQDGIIVNVSPDGDDVRVIVKVAKDGTIVVLDAHGNEVHRDEP